MNRYKPTILWRSITIITVELLLFFSFSAGAIGVAAAAFLAGDFVGRAAWAFSALLLALLACAAWFAVERRILDPELRPLRRWSSGSTGGPPTAGAEFGGGEITQVKQTRGSRLR